MQNNFKNILIINTFGIGDVLFSTPLIRAVKMSFSSAKIDFMCNGRARYVMEHNPNVSEVIVFEKDDFRSELKKSKIRFLKKLTGFIQKMHHGHYDLVIDLSLNYQLSILLRIAGIKNITGFNYRNRGRFLNNKMDLTGFDEKHVALYYMDLLKLIGIEPINNIYTETHTSMKDKEWADRFFKEKGLENKIILAIMPGGGKSWGADARYRRWPVSNFAHVADRLIDATGVTIILLGDGSEVGLCENMGSFMHNDVLNGCGKTDVGQFMALIEKCDLVLCNEGGPLHISAALGVPAVAIFGPVDEKVYGPYVKIKENYRIISDRTKCKPCYSKFKHAKCDTITCINSISQDEVFEITKEMLKDVSSKKKRLFS